MSISQRSQMRQVPYKTLLAAFRIPVPILLLIRPIETMFKIMIKSRYRQQVHLREERS